MVEIKIGDGDMGTSWIRCFTFGDMHIAQNSNSYNTTHNGIDLRIRKDTDEGIALTEAIQKESIEKILDILNECIIKHITPRQFRILLQNTYDSGYAQGGKDRIEKVCEALGIR
jgi:hypothetical protein